MLSWCRFFDHITPILATLHWLPVRERVTFKTVVLMWNLSLVEVPARRSAALPCRPVLADCSYKLTAGRR